MNSPVQEKLEEFEDVKRTLKQKSRNPFVKKQEFKPMEKTRRYEAPRKFEYNRTDKKFPGQQISTNIMKLLSQSTKMFKDINTTHRKGITTKTTKNTQTTMLPTMLRRTIQSHENSMNVLRKLVHSSSRKDYVLKKYFSERRKSQHS
ncbi:hypothetical protein TNCT_260011 [Trichonephila clavata]|uniref:Uncharacterized protein n=1 Tax=Trichonephila clavata TaxID=2740835 RepID=A0A8X6LJC4_TRICU|nr:hypothetical protein TNCT_260011 [Trichonephila clavata]